jgi:hypothetical protein
MDRISRRMNVNLTTIVFLLLLFLATPTEANAVGVVLRVVPFFSFSRVAALDGAGNAIRDSSGNPVFNIKIDPTGVDILRMGFDFTFDPTLVQVRTDPATHGFLCGFSVNGNCPQVGGSNIPLVFGDPLPNSTSVFNIDNNLGRVVFAYDFSQTPVTVFNETNFFAFQISVIDPTRPLDEFASFVQHPERPTQFCTTASGEGCGSVPEPATILLLSTGLAGVGIKFYKRRRDKEG